MDKFTLTLDAQDLATLGKAVGQMPYAMVAPLVAKIDGQVSAQQQAAHEAAADAANRASGAPASDTAA